MTKCVVVFLSVALLAHVLAAPAAPATNSGHSHASGGSIAVGVVEGATFHGDAFSIAAEGSSNNDSNPSPVQSSGVVGDFFSKIINGIFKTG